VFVTRKNPRLIRRHAGLGSLGASWASVTGQTLAAPATAVAVKSTGSVIFISPVPSGGLTEGYYDGAGAYRTRPVPKTIMSTSGGGSAVLAPNADWMPPGYTFQGTAIALARQGRLLPSWRPPVPLNKVSFLASKPYGEQRTSISTFGGGIPPQPVTYFSSPQYEMDVGLWWKFGIDAGYITRPKESWISKAIEYAVEAIVIAGIAYGAWLAAAQATSAGAATTAAPTAAAPEAATVATTAAPEAATAATTATTATTGTTVASVAKAAAGYAAEAKDIYGVALAIRAATSQPPGAVAAPSLDTTYGSGSGGGAGGSGGVSLFDQLTSGNNPLYIGLGLAAVFVAFTLSQPKRRAH
jgi:hypothetical protein